MNPKLFDYETRRLSLTIFDKYFTLGCIFTFSLIATFNSTALIPHLNILVDHLTAHT